MRVVIIGASGLIGGAFERIARSDGNDVVATYASKPRAGLIRFDLMRDSLLDLVPDLRTEDAVVLLSAQIDQNWVFDHPDEARRINVDGAKACMEAAQSRGAHLVFMSTEAVFGLGRVAGADEQAVPAPLSLYAHQKAEAEAYLRHLGGPWCLARTGSTVGWGDDLRCSVSATYRSLLTPGAKMASDNIFTITAVDDVVTGLGRIIRERYCGIVHLAANPPVTRVELADLIIRSSRFGSRMSYREVQFSSLKFREQRAARAWLRNEKARAMGLVFEAPLSTVARKVAKLDQMVGPGIG